RFSHRRRGLRLAQLWVQLRDHAAAAIARLLRQRRLFVRFRLHVQDAHHFTFTGLCVQPQLPIQEPQLSILPATSGSCASPLHLRGMAPESPCSEAMVRSLLPTSIWACDVSLLLPMPSSSWATYLSTSSMKRAASLRLMSVTVAI